MSEFISKEKGPPLSPDLNPLDFSIWSILEYKVSAYHYKNMEALKATLLKKWGKISQAIIRDSCKALCKRLQQVMHANERHTEKIISIRKEY